VQKRYLTIAAVVLGIVFIAIGIVTVLWTLYGFSAEVDRLALAG